MKNLAKLVSLGRRSCSAEQISNNNAEDSGDASHSHKKSEVSLSRVEQWSQPLLVPNFYGCFPGKLMLHFASKGNNKSKTHLLLTAEQGPTPVPLYSVTIDTAAKASLVLHSRPNIHAPPLAFAGSNTELESEPVIITPRPELNSGANHVESMRLHSENPLDTYHFRAPLGSPGSLQEYYEEFQWRQNPGHMNTGSRLVRLSSSTANHEDVVCLWQAKESHNEWDKNFIGTFTFLNSGLTGGLGPRWALMALMTGLWIAREYMPENEGSRWKTKGTRIAKKGGKVAVKGGVKVAWQASKVGLYMLLT